MRTLEVLVPKPGSQAGRMIDPGSGIVHDPNSQLLGAAWSADDRDRIEVYFEGNRYGAVNMRAFEDKVKHAAGRLAQRYPTVAHGFFPRDEFVVVGTYTFSDDWSETRLEIADVEAARMWVVDLKEE